MSSKTAYVQPVADSLSVFKEGIFNGKVLFCTGGGSGICKAMTEAVVSLLTHRGKVWLRSSSSPDETWGQLSDSGKEVSSKLKSYRLP